MGVGWQAVWTRVEGAPEDLPRKADLNLQQDAEHGGYGRWAPWAFGWAAPAVPTHWTSTVLIGLSVMMEMFSACTTQHTGHTWLLST